MGDAIIHCFVILSVTIIVSSSAPELGNSIPDRVFDYDLYEDVLDPERCQEQLSDMRTFECEFDKTVVYVIQDHLFFPEEFESDNNNNNNSEKNLVPYR